MLQGLTNLFIAKNHSAINSQEIILKTLFKVMEREVDIYIQYRVLFGQISC